MYLLVYVDDIVITGSSERFIKVFIAKISKTFAVKNLRNLKFFLGVEMTQTSSRLRLSQHRYILDLLQRTNMVGAKPAPTPMVTDPVLTKLFVVSLNDPFKYRSTVGALQYLVLTQPNITYTVNKTC